MAYPGQGYGPPGGGGGDWNHHHHPPPPPPGAPGFGYGPPAQPSYGYHQGPPMQQQQPYPNQQQGQQGYGYQGQAFQQQQQQQQNYQSFHHNQQQGQAVYGYGGPLQQQQQQYHQTPPRVASAAPMPLGAPIPQQSQQFGHGAPQGYTFQYSNCTGKRKALIIGINYYRSSAELKGCVNDATNISTYLQQQQHYKREDMVILTDDQAEPMLQPTKQNILRAMNWLVSGAQPNDSLFLHYSGHGGQTKDLDGDEDDGYDEVIYPVDFKTRGHIVDDEIHAIVVSPLQAGVRLTAIFDSCHSGSVMDLPYLYSTKGVLKEPNLAKEAGQGLLSAVMSYARGDMSGVTSSIMGFAKSALGGGDKAYEKTIRTKTSAADVILWSGSKDDQTSADATIASKATGAMSFAFIKVMETMNTNQNMSYVALLGEIREVLKTKYSQKPQLSCSHPLDTNLRFIM